MRRRGLDPCVRPATIVLALLVLLALAGTATADLTLRTKDYRMPRVTLVHYWVNFTLTPPDSNDHRTAADANGDHIVTEQEARIFEEAEEAAINERLVEPLATLDKQAPTSQRAVAVATRGLQGSTVQSADVQMDIRYELAYAPNETLKLHQFIRPAGSSDLGPVRVTVPPEFKVKWTRGIFDYSDTGDLRTTEGRSDGHTQIEVIFLLKNAVVKAPTQAADVHGPPEKGSSRLLPGPAALLGLAALAFGVGWRRR